MFIWVYFTLAMMNISESKNLFPFAFKDPKSLLFWFTYVASLCYAVKSSALLFGNYFNIFVFSQALSYLAITISLFFLSRVSVIFTVINLCLSAYIFFQIYLLHGILQFTREGIIKQLFHLWLVSYAGYLYNKGMLK